VPNSSYRLCHPCVCRPCAFLLAFLLTGCGYPLIRSGQIENDRPASVEANLARIRELEFTRPVPLVIKTPEQAQRTLVAKIARDHSDEDLRIGGESGVMTGLYPPNIDLKRQTLELLQDEIVGFYDPDTMEMVMVQQPHNDPTADGPGLGADISAMVVAHELTHALQDQHFAIDKMLKRVKDNDDRSLALKCVAEGDATLAGFAYIAGPLQQNKVDALVNKLQTLPADPGAKRHNIPMAVRVPMLFEYSSGSRFAAEAWRRGGWRAVDQLYQNPPRSSQQIMQPELYFDRPTPPVRIELNGYQALLAGWKKVDDDTYGELLLSLIFQQNLPANAKDFATLSKWAGDRIITLRQGEELTLLWLIAFRDRTSAEEFAQAYSKVLEELGARSNPHGVATRGAVVLVAIGPGVHDFARLAEAVWSASRVMPSPPEQPGKPIAAAISVKS
jgi:hypothetical protein